jgi:hypothetical protein
MSLVIITAPLTSLSSIRALPGVHIEISSGRLVEGDPTTLTITASVVASAIANIVAAGGAVEVLATEADLEAQAVVIAARSIAADPTIAVV